MPMKKKRVTMKDFLPKINNNNMTSEKLIFKKLYKTPEKAARFIDCHDPERSTSFSESTKIKIILRLLLLSLHLNNSHNNHNVKVENDDNESCRMIMIVTMAIKINNKETPQVKCYSDWVTPIRIITNYRPSLTPFPSSQRLLVWPGR